MILHINSKNRRFNKTEMFKYLGTDMNKNGYGARYSKENVKFVSI